MRIREAVATFRGHRVPHLDLIKHRNWWFAVSGTLIVLSIAGLLLRGLNFSIAFTGGEVLQFENRSGASVAEFQRAMARHGLPDAEVEVVGSNQVNIRTEGLGSQAEKAGGTADATIADVAKIAGISANDVERQEVGPTWGRTISSKMLLSLIVFLVLVTVYISFRFEWKMAVSALVALAHDLIITAGIYALVGREVTPETIIAVLTILGYSLYDTVVIFDKVKENTESAALVARDTYSGVVNISLNQTLMRSVNTSLVVLLPIGSLLLFGGQTLKDFAFALFIGVASGTYSSIFVASPMLALLKEREPRYRQIRARAQARAARPGLRTATRAPAQATSDADGELEPAAAAVSSVPATAAARRAAGSSSSGARQTSAARKKKPQQKGGKPKRRRR